MRFAAEPSKLLLRRAECGEVRHKLFCDRPGYVKRFEPLRGESAEGNAGGNAGGSTSDSAFLLHLGHVQGCNFRNRRIIGPRSLCDVPLLIGDSCHGNVRKISGRECAVASQSRGRELRGSISSPPRPSLNVFPPRRPALTERQKRTSDVISVIAHRRF